MRDLILSFKTTAALQVLNLATGVLAARLLTPEGRGELALVMLWPLVILAVGSLSVDQATSYHVARARRQAGRVAASAFLLSAALDLAIIPIGLIALTFAYGGGEDALLPLATAYFVVMALFHGVAINASAVLVSLGRVGAWNAGRLLQPSLYLAGLLLLLALEAVSLATVLAANAAAAVLSGLLIIALAWRACPRPRRPKRASLTALGRYAARVHVGSLGEIAYGRVDQMVIAALLSPRDLGLYVVGSTLARAIGLVSQTLVPLAFPRISAQAAHAGRLIVLGRYLRFALGLSAAAAVATALLAPWLLSLLFGSAYAAASEVTRILVWAVCLQVARGLLSHGMKALGRPGLVSRLTWIGLPVSLVATAALAWLHGLPGAAAGVLIGEAAAVAVLLVALATSGLGRPLALVTPSLDDWRLARRRLGETLRSRRGAA